MKLVAALLVPLSVLVAFAAFQVRDAADAADAARRQADLASAGLGPGGLVAALQNERNDEASRVIGAENTTDPEDALSSAELRATTDTSISNFTALIVRLDPAAAQVYAPALALLDAELDRARALTDAVPEPYSTDNTPAAQEIFSAYSDLISSFQTANTAVSVGIDDRDLRTGVELLQAISRQKEIESVLVRQATLGGVLGDAEATRDALRLSGAQRVGELDIRALGVGPYTDAVVGRLDDPARLEYLAILDRLVNDPTSVSLDDLAAGSDGSKALTNLQNQVGALVGTEADSIVIDAEQRQRDFLYVAVASILAVALITYFVGRSISRPLRRLTAQANAMATERLPRAVNEILETPLGEDIEVPQLAEVSVRAGGEVARVGEALNQVQLSAVELAVEQAVLRRNFADSFVNLGRRNQNLLGRQLDLVTDLEQHESDPEALDNLFKIDHLATRMRRNAESLLVLAGLEPPRQWVAPLPVGDVVRGALGEVEDYQRSEIRELDDARVTGAAAADVSHILSELLENGLQFSPPSEPVELFGRSTNDGYVITIVDRGFGMSAKEIDRANQRLAAAESFTVAPSRYLGHYVAAHLAKRHHITVTIGPSPTGGVSAEVLLPIEIVEIDTVPPDPVRVDAATPTEAPDDRPVEVDGAFLAAAAVADPAEFAPTTIDWDPILPAPADEGPADEASPADEPLPAWLTGERDDATSTPTEPLEAPDPGLTTASGLPKRRQPTTPDARGTTDPQEPASGVESDSTAPAPVEATAPEANAASPGVADEARPEADTHPTEPVAARPSDWFADELAGLSAEPLVDPFAAQTRPESSGSGQAVPPSPEASDAATMLPRRKRRKGRGSDTRTESAATPPEPSPVVEPVVEPLTSPDDEAQPVEPEPDATWAASTDDAPEPADPAPDELDAALDAALDPAAMVRESHDPPTEGGLTRRVRGAHLPTEDVHQARAKNDDAFARRPSGEDVYSALADFRAGQERGRAHTGPEPDWLNDEGVEGDVE